MTAKMDRRRFIATTTVGGADLAPSGLPIVAGPFSREAGVDHFVPADKKLSPGWVRELFARGEPAWYSGDDLGTIGMPIGGLFTCTWPKSEHLGAKSTRYRDEI